MCNEDVPPSPKVQFQATSVPLGVVDVSVKLTVNGAIPDTGLAVKFAWGLDAAAVTEKQESETSKTLLLMAERTRTRTWLLLRFGKVQL